MNLPEWNASLQQFVRAGAGVHRLRVSQAATFRSLAADIFGPDTATADAFGVIGAIPAADGRDMVINRAGALVDAHAE